MTTEPATSFDVDAFCAAMERWDVDALAALFADDAVWVEIDRTTPPAAPAVLEGKAAITEALLDFASRNLSSRIEEQIVQGDRVALRVRCSYPDGKQVVDQPILELRDGLVARWSGVQAWDE